MRSSGPPKESHTFHKDDQVLLEATNLQTTHPKAKLAPRCYRPFKVLWASPTNCKLELPAQMRIHPVFHNSLLKPYKETTAHGQNFARPLPEIVGGKEGHYEIERILTSRPTRNRKSTQYLVKWKGYPDSENSWLPAKELQSVCELLKQFHNRQVRLVTTNQALQAQWKPKEGIKRGTPKFTYPPLKPSYSQIVKTKVPPCDPEKWARDPGKVTHDSSCDPLPTSVPRDQSHDQTRSRAYTRPRDPTRFGRATQPLIGTWKTVGTNQRSTRSRGIPQGIPHSLSPMDTGTGNTLISLRA